MSDPLRLVVFLLDGQRHGLSLDTVERVLPMVAISRLPEAPAIALGVISIAGRVLPVVDLRPRSGLLPRDYGLSARLLVVRTARRTLVIPADAVTGVEEVAAEAIISADTVLPGLDPALGIARLDDGLLFIHDLDAFLSLDDERRLDSAMSSRPP